MANDYLRTPKGWTGPKVVDGKQIEGTFRAHQVPIMMDKPEHLKMLEDWLKSYHPEELFTEDGHLRPELRELAPKGHQRISANPHTMVEDYLLICDFQILEIML